MPEKTVLMSRQEAICTITINRPSAKNAWTREFASELAEAFRMAGKEAGNRVVVLEGAGRDFSSGADIGLFKAEFPAPVWLDGMRDLKDLILVMRRIPQPVIAKVRGVAIGGGINLALAADFVVAAETARFCENFSNIGIVVDAGGNFFLPRLVGLVKARELALLGDVIDGKTAAAMGLIYKSVPEAELDAAVAALADRLAGKSLEAMALIKEALDTSFEMSLPSTLEWEAAHQAVMTQTEALKAAARLFLQSRGKG
ncbi:MAG: enoyl-CoA hydratase [Deltaproteobacteria bacterium HGW-Deltaproteobacteria-19]|jgi:2-(1,2-epoxy-1,2-dihydrophenyl)acetyl-CoA isomerase|nr:MAG: enoyl-CoA hydratase [Deltaproteobacteria bacterium HGW-Deltaproteobacteria-19]